MPRLGEQPRRPWELDSALGPLWEVRLECCGTWPLMVHEVVLKLVRVEDDTADGLALLPIKRCLDAEALLVGERAILRRCAALVEAGSRLKCLERIRI